PAGRRVDRVDDVVVALTEPQGLAVDADVAHVGATASGDRPGRHDLLGREVDDRHRAGTVRGVAADVVLPAVGDVELGAVAARVQPVRADAGRDGAGLDER